MCGAGDDDVADVAATPDHHATEAARIANATDTLPHDLSQPSLKVILAGIMGSVWDIMPLISEDTASDESLNDLWHAALWDVIENADRLAEPAPEPTPLKAVA